MPNRRGRYVIELPGKPEIISWAAAVGKNESEGPLSDEFDIKYSSDKKRFQ